MLDLLYVEMLKLKRAKMFFVSLIGASAAPVMCFIEFLVMRAKKPNEPIEFERVFSDTNLYVLLVVGVLLYGVITAYLFNREYVEDTLKNILTIPVSRVNLIVSKFILLLMWIMVLTMVSWGETLIFGLIGQFEGLSTILLIKSFKEYVVGGFLIFLLTTPSIFVTLLYKNYVPTIIFVTIVTMGSIMTANSQYKALYPWASALVIATNSPIPEYPLEYSYIAILGTFLMGALASIIYFKKVDIH